MDLQEKVLYKVYAAVLGTTITVVTQKALTSAWKIATGEEPPEPGDPDVPAFQAFIWAISSGVGIGIAQLATTRYTARHWGALGSKPKPRRTTFKV
ncbi:DUF4235 domain-containing protein [Aestuariimicrobium sp. p3-SID1156]|uniref:DUF4235 domain-containing protein n=1 Tax=Aestuariimicrobium sp. p3-SID1156 TaxID=2916038 RepID=UPI00223AF842|nr:DUF4235 domain-containing protein [Aestuariimicrobium sp. p3-SID1156]MCT1459039.1 DUF4235 domain-containing protein [Aestuariimicrobium sp. p3-SID1156]